jgi:hypothetical protein
MSSRGHPTPPFNSPYQHAMKPATLLHSPAYPSPAQSDSESSRYAPEGLGLYNFSPQFPSTVSHPGSILFPPSPHPNDAWTALANHSPPMISEPIVDPWTSGAYDHPVCRSPLPWPHYQDSHRSSLSSHRAMSVYSGEGSENGFVQVKLESGSEWTNEEGSSPPSTVVPERLLHSSVFPPYDHSYSSPMMSKYETTPDISQYPVSMPTRERLESSPLDTRLGPTPRIRRRRNKTTPADAKYSCELCGRGFCRSYNKKSHMERHKENREKQFKCDKVNCTMEFDRKTDLDRHIKSVHLKIKDWICHKCGDAFSRKDTLRRQVYEDHELHGSMTNMTIDMKRTAAKRKTSSAQARCHKLDQCEQLQTHHTTQTDYLGLATAAFTLPSQCTISSTPGLVVIRMKLQSLIHDRRCSVETTLAQARNSRHLYGMNIYIYIYTMGG